MKEYTYQLEHTWEKQRRPIVIDYQHQHHHHHHRRCSTGDDAAVDADASSMCETTSESGVSDLETSMTDIRCTCCPYGYHLDTDFVKFLDDMYGPDVLNALKTLERKRHDVRNRLIEEQKPIRTSTVSSSARNSTSLDSEIIRETILELDRIVEKDIKDLAAECHRHAGNQSEHCQHIQQQRSRSVDTRRQHRPPPRPPTSSSSSSVSRTAEERRLTEHRIQTEKFITTRTRSVPRLNTITNETKNSLRKIDLTSSGPVTLLYKVPPPLPSRSSSSSSLSTETTLRVSSPELDNQRNEPLKPLYITEIVVPPKPVVRVQEQPIKTTVVTITNKNEIELRNREIERLELERKALLNEKELLLKEIERYKRQTSPKIPEKRVTTSVTVLSNHEQIHAQPKPSTREVAMQHVVEDDKPPPLPPKQRQQRDVAINHRTEYDEDEEKQVEIVRRKLEEIKNFYTERIHILEDKILEQEQDIQRLTEPKKQRHVNTQCQPTMQDRALITDTFRSVRDVALTCYLQPTLPPPVARRDVNLQCNTDDLIKKRDVCMETVSEKPTQRDVSIGVSIDVTPDKHFRDVGTCVNFDFKPEIRQRDVATMFAPEPIEKSDRASNTQIIQTREFGAFANTIEPPKLPPKPSTRVVATDTFSLITQKDTASGRNEIIENRDMSTDTTSLINVENRASGHDIPPELLSRHVSTDTRTLVSIRDNFSATTPSVQIDAQTQSLSAVQHDASSNTLSPADQRHMSVQTIEEQPSIKHNSTSTDIDMFHQLGHLRHNLTNTEIKRSTDRSTVTERSQSRDSAINTEPKIMYSKDVGDFDVNFIEKQKEEITWNSLYGRSNTVERGFQTDLFDTKRTVGYIEQDKDNVEEHQQEIITFRLPLERRTTEEIYETTVTTETKQNKQQIEEIRTKTKPEDLNTTFIKSDIVEWTRPIGHKVIIDNTQIQEKQRSISPEELIEESYEIVSTVTKPRDGNFLITSTIPRSTVVQKYADLSTTKFQSSEDDSSYCEEWTVTEAKRKQDGQTVKTIIDRGGHHRYNIDVDSASNHQQYSSGIGKKIIEDNQSNLKQFDSHSSDLNSRLDNNDRQIEEKYEITISSYYDESGLKVLSSKPMEITSSDTGDRFEFDEEIYIACAILNESLYDKNADKKKVNNSLSLIQQEWFHLTNDKDIDFRLIEGFLNSVKENFSNFLLERIVNLQDANGNTALHYCVTAGHWHVVNMLLDTKVCDVCLQNDLGYTATMMAAVMDIINDDQRRIVSRLLHESGNVNVKTFQTQQTALMLAVQHAKSDMIELLLSNGAAVNLQDSDGLTALMYAVEQGSLNIVKLLLTRSECDVDIVNNNGQTAISIAANKNRKNILVELYAKIKDRKGHHSALGIKQSASSRLPIADRSMNNNSFRRTTTETVSSTSRRHNVDNTGPTVSSFRRHYSTK